jgi:capsular exopolysaccharide synthesis family protein
MKDMATQISLPAPDQQRLSLPEEEQSIDLREYWYIVYRHRRAVLAFLLIAVFLTAITIRWESGLYTAKTTVFVPAQQRSVLDTPESANSATASNQTQQKLLTSRSLVASVIKDLGLEKVEDFTNRPISVVSWLTAQLRKGLKGVMEWLQETQVGAAILEALGVDLKAKAPAIKFEFGVHPALIDGYFERLTVMPLTDTSLVDVQIRSPNAALARDIANAHVAAFIRSALETRFELTAEAREFLEKKLTELKENVAKSERALTSFQRDHHIVSMDKGNSLVLDSLRKLNSDLTEAQSRRIDLESLHRIVQKRDNQLLSQIIDNPTIQGLRKQITALETQDAHLGTKFKPNYRGRVAIQQELDEAKARLDQEISRVVGTIEKDYGAAKAREQALMAETEKSRRAALDLQEKAVEYAVLEREVVSNRTLYETVFKKTRESTLTGEGPIPNLRVVDRAEIPLIPATPDWVKTLLLGVGVGLFGGIGLAFLLHLLDNTLKTPQEVERLLGLPILGLVPDVGKLAANSSYGLAYTKKIPPPGAPLALRKRGDDERLMIAHHPLSLMGEMYRSICTAIMFSKAERPPRTILVSSSQPNEGKTVTAINIAMMLAQNGVPVLLIDADLHGGRCHTLLGLENGSGLSNILTGTEDFTARIKKTNVKNLSLLSRGTLPPNPAALLGSDKMRRILHSLAADFHFIVLDSAPLLPVSDTVLLSTMIDGVILVAKGHEVPGDIVCRARDRLNFVAAKILGVVLNGVDITGAEYTHYRHVYRSHYTHYAEQFADDPTAMSTRADEKLTPPELLDSIIVRLTEFIGPIASVIVSQKINALGATAEAFPQSQIEDLVEAVAQEILDTKSKISFRQQCSDWVRSANLS